MNKLLFNHFDAWGVTFIICSSALLFHEISITVEHLIPLSAIVAGYWYAFALNDYFDQEIDAVDMVKSQNNFFISTHLSYSTLIKASILVFSYILVAFLQIGLKGLGTFVLCLLISFAYSAPPLRLKNIPIIDVLTHAMFVQTFPYCIILLFINATLETYDLMIIILLVLSSTTAQIEQQIRDYYGDLQTNTRTTVGMIGISNAKILVKIFSGIAMLISGWAITSLTFPLWVWPLFIAAAPIVILRFIPESYKLPYKLPYKLIPNFLTALGCLYIIITLAAKLRI